MIEIWFIKDDITREAYKDETPTLKMWLFSTEEVQLTRQFLRTPSGTSGRYWTDDSQQMTDLKVSEGGIIAKYNHAFNVWVSENPIGHWSDLVVTNED